MGREIVALTADRLDDLPAPCATCLFWERGGVLGARRSAGAEAEKSGWLATVLLDWGNPGHLVYVDGRAAGYLSYAPATFVPRTRAFPTGPIADDAVLLMTARVSSEFTGQGLGRLLVHAAAKDVMRRGVRAIEAFGSGPGTPASECVLPADFLRAVGFQTVRWHPVYPRLRLDVRAIARWRSEVEQAMGRLLRPVRGLGPRSPVGTTTHAT